jgi:hypothetical protein
MQNMVNDDLERPGLEQFRPRDQDDLADRNGKLSAVRSQRGEHPTPQY